MARTRVAVYGGDDRVSRLTWPDHLNVKHYSYKSPTEQRKLQESISAGKVKHLILLTGYMGHSAFDTLKNSGVNIIKFPRSPMQLSREIGDMIPRTPEVHHLQAPPQIIVTMKDPVVETPAPPPSQVAEEPVQTGPVSVADAITRLLRKEGMTQKSFAQLIGVAQATVSSWSRNASLPTGDRLAKLIELIPELVHLEAPTPGKNETVTVQVTRHVEDDELLVAVHEWQAARTAVKVAKERLRLAEERMEGLKR